MQDLCNTYEQGENCLVYDLNTTDIASRLKVFGQENIMSEVLLKLIWKLFIEAKLRKSEIKEIIHNSII